MLISSFDEKDVDLIYRVIAKKKNVIFLPKTLFFYLKEMFEQEEVYKTTNTILSNFKSIKSRLPYNNLFKYFCLVLYP
jgi:hypothetical protein